MKNVDKDFIVPLKGPDRVRKRPAVIFTSDGVEGAAYAVKMLLDIFTTEAALGFSKELSLQIRKDNAIRIKSMDRGFVLDETIIDGMPVWRYDFCELFAGPREIESLFPICEERNHNKLYGDMHLPAPKYQAGDCLFLPALCCVQYASEFMEVESVHKDTRKTLHFQKGYSVSDLKREHAPASSYTQIDFRLDPEVFSDIAIPFDSLAPILKYAAMTNPGFKCSITDERTSANETYLFPLGAIDYTLNITDEYQTTAFYTKEIEAIGKDRYNRPEYCARAKVALGFSDVGNITECIHNYNVLEYGGQHLNAAMEEIKKILDWKIIKGCNQTDLTTEDIFRKVVIVLETNCTNGATSWMNGTRTSIQNKMIIDMCVDLFDDDFSYYIEKNKEAIISLLK